MGNDASFIKTPIPRKLLGPRILVTVVASVTYLSQPMSTHIGVCDEPVRNRRPVGSELVSLGEGDFILISENRHDLQLRHMLRGNTSVQNVKPHFSPLNSQGSKLSDDETNKWPPEHVKGEIAEIALSRWSRTSLVAVVKLCNGKESVFWCLTFDRSTIERKTPDISPFASVIANGSCEDQILALSGTRDPPTIAAFIGRKSLARPGTIDSGIIFIDGCANAGALVGRLGSFKPEYVPEDYDEPDENKK